LFERRGTRQQQWSPEEALEFVQFKTLKNPLLGGFKYGDEALRTARGWQRFTVPSESGGPSFRIFERNCKKNEEQEKIWVLVRLVSEQLQWSPEKVAAGLHWAPPATMKALECKLNESAGHDGFIPTQY
jgi:hypothetical protein